MPQRLRLIAVLLLSLPMVTVAEVGTRLFDWQDTARGRAVPAKLYTPKSIDGAAAVVIFSPGLGGVREAYKQWATAWAEHGYVVLVLEHVGSNINAFKPGSGMTPQSAMTAGEMVDRAKDVQFALAELVKMNAGGDALAGKLDLTRVAMAGHSYGAVTTQSMVGQRYAGKTINGNATFKCAIIMSGSPPRQGDPATAFAGITTPLLHLTGTRDDAPIGGTTATQRRIPFDTCPATPQTLITFKDADHGMFSGRKALLPEKAKLQAVVHPLIIDVTTKFLDAHLRDEAASAEWMKTGLTAAIGSAGVVEQK